MREGVREGERDTRTKLRTYFLRTNLLEAPCASRFQKPIFRCFLVAQSKGAVTRERSHESWQVGEEEEEEEEGLFKANAVN